MARHNNRDSRRYYDWMERAREDMACAKLLLGDENCYNAVAFHCQQTIEKALKAYILLNSNMLMDGHNLSWLCKRAMRYDEGFARWFDESAELNKCYIETRYPSDLPLDLDYGQVCGYYEMARDMYRFICQETGETLAEHGAHPSQA